MSKRDFVKCITIAIQAGGKNKNHFNHFLFF